MRTRVAVLAVALAAVVPALGMGGARAGCNPNLAWQDTDPVASPLDERIALLREEVGCGPAPKSLLVIKRDGSVLQRFRNASSRASWSPDARRLVFSALGRVTIVDAPGRGLDQLGIGSDPVWGPTREIAFLRNGDLWVVDPRTQVERRILADGRLAGPLLWTPTGSDVLAVRDARPAARDQLLLVARDGRVRELTDAAGRIATPSLVDDARSVVFATDRDGNWEIYAVRLVGGALSNLTRTTVDEVVPVPSPDGRTLALTRRVAPDEGVLTVMELDGSEQRVIGFDAHPYSPPTWGPLGTSIAYASGQECLRWGIHLVQLGSDAQRRISNRCRFVGTRRRETLRGTPFMDILYGQGGNDIVVALGGPDRAHGGPGDDRVDGGAGHDRLDGGSGDDHLLGGRGADTIYAGAGRDRITGGHGNDVIVVSGDPRPAWSDVVDCGPGRDEVRINWNKVLKTSRNCETVRRAYLEKRRNR